MFSKFRSAWRLLKKTCFTLVSWPKVAKESLQLRTSSAPYLSGDTFRAVCRSSYGDAMDLPFLLGDVREGDAIFCCNDVVDTFLTDVAPRIPVRFVLVSGNADRNVLVDESIVPPQVAGWFSQNLVEAPGNRIHTLPIGLENAHYQRHGDTKDFDALRRRLPKRKRTRILYGFRVSTNPQERTKALLAAERAPLCVTIPPSAPRRYRKFLVQYQFVLSPEGNGIDCHRTWEAFYLHVIPVLRRTAFSQSLHDLGLPVLLLDDWNDLETLSESWLHQFYVNEAPKFHNPCLWLPYWEERFRSLGSMPKARHQG